MKDADGHVVITTPEKYQLIGLLTLAENYRKNLEDIQRAVAQITQEEDWRDGHCSDFVWGHHGSADDLISALGIKVIE